MSCTIVQLHRFFALADLDAGHQENAPILNRVSLDCSLEEACACVKALPNRPRSRDDNTASARSGQARRLKQQGLILLISANFLSVPHSPGLVGGQHGLRHPVHYPQINRLQVVLFPKWRGVSSYGAEVAWAPARPCALIIGGGSHAKRFAVSKGWPCHILGWWRQRTDNTRQSSVFTVLQDGRLEPSEGMLRLESHI
jgi:hypothetical protein